LRRAVFEGYGNKCACCGESNSAFLQLDHVQNDGAAERRHLTGINKRNTATYRKAVKENFPDRYQLLCANCNWGKRMNGGICPHLNLENLL
jgi:hypothetical protein